MEAEATCFDVITYDKGGSVLRMIERTLVDDSLSAAASTFTSTKHRYVEHRQLRTCGTPSRSPLATGAGEMALGPTSRAIRRVGRARK